ncbi:MAG: DUF1631 family protein [Pseudomonadota bacterium]
MHIPKRIIRLAKERALTSFSALAEQTVVEADNLTTRAMADASPGDLRTLTTVRTFLRGEARTLRGRMDRHFAGLLERAMQTMHVDLRNTAAQEINYQTLTLIDDEVVTRQIEVDRLVGRLRDVEPVALGRVNLTIAMMHNDSEARERENPFRPYLLARALHEALRELMWEESQSRQLFDVLSMAMANRMTGFYAGILDVFEADGVTARLVARPTSMPRAERDRLAWENAAKKMFGGGASGSVGGSGTGGGGGNGGGGGGGGGGSGSGSGFGTGSAHGSGSWHGAGIDNGEFDFSDPEAVAVEDAPDQPMFPMLRRLKEIQDACAGDGFGSKGQDLLDVVWNIFHQPKGTRSAPSQLSGDGERCPLDVLLLEQQLAVAAGAEPPAPLALTPLLGAVKVNAEQKRTMDVVALLFEALVQDELLTPEMHRQMARLYLPILRAALREPGLLHNGEHPVRRLVDRLGSVSVGFTPDLPGHAQLQDELDGIIGAVLDLFDEDMGVFADAESAFDGHVSALLAAGDARIAPCVAAIDEAVAACARLTGAGTALSAALQPLQIDPRVADFILGTWARVLSHSASGNQASIALLPELLWSAQEKTTPEDRSALMRMLPELVRKVREGMAAIALPEAPSKAAFDRLVAVHMDVLGNKQEPARRQMTLEQFRGHFEHFVIDPVYSSADGKDSWLGKFELEAALARHAVTVDLHARAATRMPQASDADWLAWARPGAGFEIKVEGSYRAALLCNVGGGVSAFLFSIAQQENQAIYLRGPLLEELENSTLRPLEYAPLFDRAVESLMAGAAALMP